MKSMLVIAGPSAVGKTTVSDEILRQNSKFTLIRSATTRAPRGDGHDGEYLYLSDEDFRHEIASGGMLEYAEYSGSLYGTPKSELLRAEGEGKFPLLILELSGISAVRSSEYSEGALCVYLYDSLDVLEARLHERYVALDVPDGREKFEKRRAQNIADYLTLFGRAEIFDLVLSNATPVEQTARAILEAMDGKASTTDNNKTLLLLADMARKKL